MRKLNKFIVLIMALVLLLPARAVSAHGHTTAGPYTLEIGFQNEPALVGQPNGLELTVSKTDGGAMVSGLEETLQVEIIFGASRKTLALEPVEGEEGHYTAFVIPTRVGDYTWHLTGKIEATDVDVSMTSSPTTFGSVEELSTASFPDAAASTTQLQADLQSARQTSQLALALGAGALLLSLITLVLLLARRQR